MGLSVVSQTRCRIEVFPAFALSITSTRNLRSKIDQFIRCPWCDGFGREQGFNDLSPSSHWYRHHCRVKKEGHGTNSKQQKGEECKCKAHCGTCEHTKISGSGSNPVLTRSEGFGDCPNLNLNHRSGSGQHPNPNPKLRFGPKSGTELFHHYLQSSIIRFHNLPAKL